MQMDRKSNWDRYITQVLNVTDGISRSRTVLNQDAPMVARHKIGRFQVTDAFLREFLVHLNGAR